MAPKNKTWTNNSPPTVEDSDYNTWNSEFNNTFLTSGQTPDNGDLQQTAKAMSIYTAGGDFYVDSGIANAYVVSSVASFLAPIDYFQGMRVRFVPNNTNAGASTINVATLGVKNIKLRAGVDPQAGQIAAGIPIELFYDGTDFIVNSFFNASLNIDQIQLPYDPAQSFSGSVFSRVFQMEDISSVTRSLGSLWNKGLIGNSRVFLEAQVTGSAATPFQMAFRIVNADTVTTLFETNNLFIDNQSAQEFTWISIDISSGNVVDLDLSVTDLQGINALLSDDWDFDVKGLTPSGGYFLRDLRFVLRKF